MTDATELPPPLVGTPVPDDDLLALLRGWIAAQRWYPAKGSEAALPRVATVPLTDPLGAAQVAVHLLALPGGGVLQVPVTVRPATAPRPAAAVTIGTLPRDDGDVVVLDGCLDPAFLRAWLVVADHDDPLPFGDLELHGAVRGLGGEQSNTSVLLPTLDPPAILKVFRVVGEGANPDVEVPLALQSAGWRGVPRPLAWVRGSWPTTHGPVAGHLGVLSELVVGARDGFELACAMAGAGNDLADLAVDLGRTTAQMHRALRTALPTPGGDRPADPAAVLATLRRRAAEAQAAVPELAERAGAIDAVLGAVGRLDRLPPLQRVHGDFHLGQVLRSPTRWAVLDFEGEPQASAQERARPDLALRDLAGILRSVDYAAAVGGAADGGWAARARAGLVAGYLEQAGEGPSGAGATALLRALELDKALYEVVYEVRNRPDWVAIPLAGVDRLLATR